MPKTGKKADLISRLQEHDLAQSHQKESHDTQMKSSEGQESLHTRGNESKAGDIVPETHDNATENNESKDQPSDKVADQDLTNPGSSAEVAASTSVPQEAETLSAVSSADNVASQNVSEGFPEEPAIGLKHSKTGSTEEVTDNLSGMGAGAELPVEDVGLDTEDSAISAARAELASSIDEKNDTDKAVMKSDADQHLIPAGEAAKRKAVDDADGQPNGKHVKAAHAVESQAQEGDESVAGPASSHISGAAFVDSSQDGATEETACALYIRDITRPFSLPNFRSLLCEIAKQEPSQLVLDHYKTHAYVTFSSHDAARKVKDSLHGQGFPMGEPGRKPLSIHFLPVEFVHRFVDQEQQADKSTKWHVQFTPTAGDELIDAKLVKDGEPIARSESDAAVTATQKTRVLKLSELFKQTVSKPTLYYLPARDMSSKV